MIAVERAAIVAAARGWLGTPFHHQASLQGVGCDCLGLLRGVYRDLYGSEPEVPPAYSRLCADRAGTETLAEAACCHLRPLACGLERPGDVLLFRWRPHLPARHCAIMSGDDTLIHAQDGAAVTEVPFTLWWRRRLSHVFSFPEVID